MYRMVASRIAGGDEGPYQAGRTRAARFSSASVVVEPCARPLPGPHARGGITRQHVHQREVMMIIA
jgi:hypothetical protein